MTWRLLILSVAFACAAAQAPLAFAKPPEEEAGERAERAAERAAKAAERANDSIDRATERDTRDREDRRSSGGDRDDSKDRDDRDDDRNQDRVARSRDGGDIGTKLVSVSSSDDSDDEDKDDARSDAIAEKDQDDRSSQSISGSSGGSQEELEGDDVESDNSGSGSSDDDSEDDHSGSNHSDDDESDDEDEDDDNNRDLRSTFVALENDDAGNPFRDGELVVMSDDSALLNRAEALGFSVIESRPLESIGALVARLRRPEGISSNEALAMLRTREPGSPSGYNYIYRATGNAPAAPEEDRPEPQKSAVRKLTVKIGVIDGFSADTVSGWNVERLVDKPARVGHGDAVTGILLRDLEAGYRVSPEKLMLLDVMREHPGGGAADVAALVFAFDKLVTAKVGVANLSLAGPDHPALRMAVTKSIQKGLVVVAAVGNGGPAAPPAFPAAYDGVVGVAAVDATGKPYIYSGRGPHVDIAALGVEVDTNGTGGELAGTSYAAPHVSALLASLSHGGKTPSLDRLLVEYAEDAGAPGRDPVFGLGILTPDKPARVALASGSSPSR